MKKELKKKCRRNSKTMLEEERRMGGRMDMEGNEKSTTIGMDEE